MKILVAFTKNVGKFMGLIIVIMSIIAMLEPSFFTWATPYIVPLLGIAMFGMGLTLRVEDFKLILLRPRDIIVGTLAQFTIMPLLAYVLAVIFKLPPDLAIGVILVGTCPGGTASNVLTYLAKGDVSLSVGMTMLSTLLSPILTPLITYLLIGTWVKVSLVAMIISVLKIVALPIFLGILINHLFSKKIENIKGTLPLISIITIVILIGCIIGNNSSKILTMGFTVVLVVIFHNLLGLLLGYLVGKILKLEDYKSSAISIEVGTQNSGLAVSLAVNNFAANPLATIPGALFSVWHNISVLCQLVLVEKNKKINNDEKFINFICHPKNTCKRSFI
ncbi:bile acid:sodium symporter family protein [Fusobacterium sp. IOR10]|uniref:bile acid:sodium symporter family protein n=1 Tax=Fusobacterium sp. IOR10 TaxID=2665157 RepID=UPI0013D72B32|nr:bile acid:sodium symporter family protein [Fusobacterium sp. IOR10]